MLEAQPTRRHVLAGIGAAALAAGAAAVTGCGSDDSPADTSGPAGPSAPGSATASGATAAPLPAYQAFDQVKPDQPASADNVVQALFTSYPAPPPKITSGPPASGGSASVMLSLDAALQPPPMSKNPFWQELNKRLGLTLDIQQTPAAQYTAKVAVTVAGNELPDMMQIKMGGAPQHLPELLPAKFADLTPYIGGDAVKDYPGIAGIPTSAWEGAVFGGRFYGVARTVPLTGVFFYIRADIVESLGESPAIESGQQLVDLCHAVTDETKNRWAMGNPSLMVTTVAQMHGGPNGWREDGGKFSHAYEDPAMKEALSTVASMWKSGLFYPDAYTNPDTRGWFGAGKTVVDLIGSDPVLMQQQFSAATPSYKLVRTPPPKWEGGGLAPYALRNPTQALTVINKKLSADRVQELLRVISYLASPFGTAEYEFLTYGLLGRDHTMDGTNPVLTKTGQKEVNPVQLGNIARPTPFNFSSDYPDIVKRTWELQKAVHPVAVFDASVGVFSDTELSKGPLLTKTITSVRDDIVQGRKSVDDWDAAVKSWRSAGGDAIRSELEASYAKAH